MNLYQTEGELYRVVQPHQILVKNEKKIITVAEFVLKLDGQYEVYQHFSVFRESALLQLEHAGLFSRIKVAFTAKSKRYYTSLNEEKWATHLQADAIIVLAAYVPPNGSVTDVSKENPAMEKLKQKVDAVPQENLSAKLQEPFEEMDFSDR